MQALKKRKIMEISKETKLPKKKVKCLFKIQDPLLLSKKFGIYKLNKETENKIYEFRIYYDSVFSDNVSNRV